MIMILIPLYRCVGEPSIKSGLGEFVVCYIWFLVSLLQYYCMHNAVMLIAVRKQFESLCICGI